MSFGVHLGWFRYTISGRLSIIFLIYATFRRILVETTYFTQNQFEFFVIIELLLLSVLSTTLFIRVTFLYDRGTINRNVFVLLSLGNGIWVIAGIIWIYYSSIQQADPFPSLADLCYMLGYIPIASALFIKARSLPGSYRAY